MSEKVNEILERYTEPVWPIKPPKPTVKKHLIRNRKLTIPSGVRGVAAEYYFYISEEGEILVTTTLTINIPLEKCDITNLPEKSDDLNYTVKDYNKNSKGRNFPIIVVKQTYEKMIQPIEFYRFYKLYLKKFK